MLAEELKVTADEVNKKIGEKLAEKAYNKITEELRFQASIGNYKLELNRETPEYKVLYDSQLNTHKFALKALKDNLLKEGLQLLAVEMDMYGSMKYVIDFSNFCSNHKES